MDRQRHLSIKKSFSFLTKRIFTFKYSHCLYLPNRGLTGDSSHVPSVPFQDKSKQDYLQFKFLFFNYSDIEGDKKKVH
ncbi:hypothetical protein BpHYR1_038898 [Brachionus plicatilis]|uniref:Uncharacterized protein n=1 Tax=Brachionus plicatilis TaxID=10195 RepID=A0A3M7PQK1_BRAPC|nr:hypothetical protein BpHYR1_038898 [Brachionus plicatilis]